MKVLTKSQVAQNLGVTTRTIDAMVQSGELPQPIIISKSKRWPEVEINNYIKSKMAARDANKEVTA